MRFINIIVFLSILIIQLSCSVILIERPSKDTISQLKDRYGVRLKSTWTAKQAAVLLETFTSIYQNSDDPNYNLEPSVWKISKKDLQEDVKFEMVKNQQHVTIRHDVFPIEDSQSEKPEVELKPNDTLFRIVAQFITDDWKNLPSVRLLLKDNTNRYMIELVLKEMYGLSLVRKDTSEAEKIAQKLHKYIGKLHVSEFTNQELLMLMSVYEKFPVRLHKIPRLKHLLRSEQAPYAGSAWIIADCVEYAALTFRIKNKNEFQRIILHEKAHFLWEYALNGKLRNQWSELGGWHKDQSKRFGWSNNNNKSEFVTPYASSKNPNEDWAESVAYYLFNPKKLRSCSSVKYDFVDRVMHKYSESGVPFARLKQLEK